MEDKIREEFRNLDDIPTQEGVDFVKEMQKLDPEYSYNFTEGFYYGYKARDEEVVNLRDALAKINNQRKNQDSYKLLVNIFEIANNALKAGELDK